MQVAGHLFTNGGRERDLLEDRSVILTCRLSEPIDLCVDDPMADRLRYWFGRQGGSGINACHDTLQAALLSLEQTGMDVRRLILDKLRGPR